MKLDPRYMSLGEQEVCCGDERWRGRHCDYHRGYDDGYEAGVAAERALADTLAEHAQRLIDLVDRDAAAGDAADAQCLKNHGLIWHWLDEALTAYRAARTETETP